MKLLEGSHAIAQTIKNINPAVVSAYPITPQTHIVEDLAKLKADGEADFEYVRAESEFAAASIVAGASATGVRVYTATSSQGLLLMNEVVYNIAGMRLPVVMTCANRGVSAPITIWNDHQDAMSIRDAGWIMLFAENHQEAVRQHILAYKIAEKTKLPVVVNVDGFVLTHSYEPVNIPDKKIIAKFLGVYKPKLGEYLNPEAPVTMGAFATPEHYMEIRQELHEDLLKSSEIIKSEHLNYHKSIEKQEPKGNGLVEYIGPKKPKTIIIAMGSAVGTIREVQKKHKNFGILKITAFRPFPAEDILKYIGKAKHVAVVEKAISLGFTGPLYSEIKTVAYGKTKANIKNYIVGLGGRDVTQAMINKILDLQTNKKEKQDTYFIG